MATKGVTLGLLAAGAVVAVGATTSPAGAISPAAPQHCTAKATSVPNNVAVPIPTGPAVASSTINVSGAGNYLLDVDAVTGLQHTFAADLDVTLQSPAGTVVTLTTDNGAGNDNVFDGTRWDDDANPGGQVPYVTNNGLTTDHAYVNLTPVATLAPEEPLGAFVGENPNGVWTLTISDDLAGDGGNLSSWSLDLSTLAAAPSTIAATSANNNVPLPIPTGPGVVAQTVNVSGAGKTLLDVEAITGLQHSFSADLDMTLQSPGGTVVTLSTDNAAGNDNVFDGTRWDDDANPIGQVPYVTNNGLVTDNAYVNLTAATPLASEEGLAAFIGEDPNGVWTLTISDDLAGDGGTLNTLALDLKTAQCDIQVTGVAIQAKKKQKFGGKLKVKSSVASTDEAVTVKVTGKVKVGNKKYSLKALTRAVAKGGNATLKQGLSGNKKKVAAANSAVKQALSQGKKVKATLTFTLTDQFGNVLKTTKKVTIRS
jgi:subtilisin-like proprotein convertase family protein